MSRNYVINSENRRNKFIDRVSIDDAVRYSVDFTPWQEDNATITGITWVAERGIVGVTDMTMVDGVATALLTFSQSGKALVSVIADTGSTRKKIWLEIVAEDYDNEPDDYGDYE